MTLNKLQGHMCPIYVTSIHESQISVLFALQPAIFEIQTIWDKCTEWPQIDLETYKVNLPYTVVPL